MKKNVQQKKNHKIEKSWDSRNFCNCNFPRENSNANYIWDTQSDNLKY